MAIHLWQRTGVLHSSQPNVPLTGGPIDNAQTNENYRCPLGVNQLI
jgi:hypothetical protein